ncbi:MAG: efflux RND transporter periplasmic adaptor subunit [Flavobacteriales bacterium]|nr:efflux RND transporter periplasmic adaptor subunit [Flavobacteriales bacterium]
MKITKIKYIIGILVIAAFTSACNSSSEKEEHGGHDEHGEEGGHGGHEEHEEGTVSLTEQQMDAIGLKIVKLEKRNMDIGVQVTGILELAPQDRADISPILGGIVKEINVIEGDKVTKGQTLAVLEHPDFIQLQQDYVNSINTLEYLEKEFARQKRLYEEKVGSGKEFQKISAEYNTKKSSVKALAIKLGMLGLNAAEIANGTIFPVVTIVSPMRGTISLVETNVGAYVEPLTKLFEVVNNDELHADFRVYEKDINKVSVGQTVFFNTTSHIGQEFEAKIHAISPVFEADPKTLHVHADISNSKSNLIPGMYIKGRIIANNVLTTVLPEHAIVTNEEKAYIFVKSGGKEHDHGHEETAGKDEHDHGHAEEKKEDDHGHSDHEEGKWTFEMVEVITGFTSNGLTEVKLLQPLAEDAQIAGNGAYYLLAEMGKGETEHTH